MHTILSSITLILMASFALPTIMTTPLMTSSPSEMPYVSANTPLLTAPRNCLAIMACLVNLVRIFSSLDARQGFLQLRLDEASKNTTAFWWGRRLMRYERLSFGTKNALAIFQRVMDEVLRAGTRCQPPVCAAH